MLPDDHEGPAGVREPLLVAPIPLDVACELGKPVVKVRLRQRRVLGTEMPEAAAAIDRDMRARKDDIRTAAQPGDGDRVLAEAHTAAVQLASQSDLERAHASVALHT